MIEDAVIRSNTQVAHETFRMALRAPQISKIAKPGQFVNLSFKQSNQANLLKRPFSVHRVSSDSVELLYKIKGVLTAEMALLKKHHHVELLGPLGNPFTIPEGRRILLVGGGIGIAPVLFADTWLRASNETRVLYGVRSRRDAVNFRGKHIHLHIDDEENRFVCEGLDKIILEWKIEEIKACGPTSMMRELVAVANRLGLETEVSLEAHMACGFGVCLGCTIETKNGYRNVCSDGPVFEGKQIW